MLEGVLFVLAALMIVAAAWEALLRPQPRATMGRSCRQRFRRADQRRLEARGSSSAPAGRTTRRWSPTAGFIAVTDVVTSLGVVLGLIGVVLTGYSILDPLLAFSSLSTSSIRAGGLIGGSLSGLMDKAVPIEDNMHIRDIISCFKGALEVHDLKTRTAGRATFIEFHLIVDGEMAGARATSSPTASRSAEAEIPSVRLDPCRAGDWAKLPRWALPRCRSPDGYRRQWPDRKALNFHRGDVGLNAVLRPRSVRARQCFIAFCGPNGDDGRLSCAEEVDVTQKNSLCFWEPRKAPSSPRATRRGRIGR